MYNPLNISQSAATPFTDYSRWRLLVNDGGRHTWHYLKTDEECEAWPQNSVDKFWLGIDLKLPALATAQTPLEAARNGYTFYKHLQSHDGHWPGEYGGPMFLLPGLVIGSYVSGMPFTEQERLEMIRYLMNRAHPEDGGWGMLLPDWVPFHPHRWWIHTRTVYIPMSYLYGVKFKMEENDIIRSLREELYPQNYYSIYWPDQRNNVCKADLYAPHSALFDMINVILSNYEHCTIAPLRKAGVERAYELIVLEDENTSYQTLGPVSKMFNLIVRAHRDGVESDAYKQHEIKRHDFMWIGRDGMMMCGTNGSQLWDVGFITQALVESGLAEEEDNKESLLKALQWLDEAQIQEDPKHHHTSYRHTTKGAWGFSTKEQGYTVSDCTGEGLKATLYLQNHLDFTPKLVSERRMCDAIDVMLTLQNPNGGFASYELIRGPRWLEWLNPAEVFGDIMTEYCYPECTTSVITSLAIFRKSYPHYRTKDIEGTISRAVEYLHGCQYPEGGWVGCWGICFTYATQFALESLSLVGETYETSERSRRACEFLIGKQRADGGWGESYKSCEQLVWVEHEQTQVVQTCWAVMSLMYAQYPHPEPIERGVKLVMSRQNPDGSWPQEAIEGVFNKTCAIAYPNFKFSFPIWMLGKADKYLVELHCR
ncbi:hypothetical protein DXG03_007817 [Asterophora parasitica]|uniref:Terpene cyclase/mutase family member n=1 Tax=Asterophora parasitica TaxID=117018 RepID=A0A9P7KEV0_9AGAR|nr:hypothetical protein DXG03_007817 [Asterophora parasitica]